MNAVRFHTNSSHMQSRICSACSVSIPTRLFDLINFFRYDLDMNGITNISKKYLKQFPSLKDLYVVLRRCCTRQFFLATCNAAGFQVGCYTDKSPRVTALLVYKIITLHVTQQLAQSKILQDPSISSSPNLRRKLQENMLV